MPHTKHPVPAWFYEPDFAKSMKLWREEAQRVEAEIEADKAEAVLRAGRAS